MIVKSIQKNVVESHDFKSEIATIDASEMRYISSLLRNNYSDTILATVRETWANAVDANAAANSSTPIKISFPTALSPTYSVRDFGTGLSEQDLFGLYTKYGRSSKRGDNSAIGGFGIGRFSPLSYTDCFTVVSCKDGEKITISVYVDESGDTRFTKLAEESTTEPNGVEIIVAVKSNDVAKFTEAAFKVLKFASAPFVTAGIDKEKLRFEWLIKNDSWGVLDAQGLESGYYHRSQGGPLIVMGGICYPLNLEILSDKLNTCAIYNSIRGSHAGAHFVFFFPVGALSLHHSRESLEYNEHTKKNIVSFFARFETEIKAVFQKVLDDINDVEKFMSKVNSIIDNYVLQNIASEMPLTFNAANGDKIEVRPNFNHSFQTVYCVNRNGNFRSIHKKDEKQLSPTRFYNSYHYILIADNKKSLFAKARWIQRHCTAGMAKGFCVFVLTPEEAKGFLTKYTTCKRIFLSSTTQELKLDQAKAIESRVVFDKSLYGYRPFVTCVNLPEEGKFYYVKLQNRDSKARCQIAGQEFGSINSYELFLQCLNLKIIDQTRIYGVFDDSDISDEAVNVSTLVEDYIKKQLKLHSESISKNAEITYRASKFRYCVKEIAISLKDGHPLKMFFGNATQTDTDFACDHRDMMDLFKITKTFVAETIDNNKIDCEHDALMKKYPLLAVVQNSYYNFGGQLLKDFASYISLIDKQQN